MPNSKQIFNIRVIPRARVNSITADADGTLRVHTTTAPEKGHANEAVVELLAEYFKIAKSRIVVSKGMTSRNKIVVIQ